jgi:hypothetical protein
LKQHPHVSKPGFVPLQKVCRFNWVVFAGASIVLWAFVIGVLAADKTDPEAPCTAVNPALTEFGMWQHWITQATSPQSFQLDMLAPFLREY